LIIGLDLSLHIQLPNSCSYLGCYQIHSKSL